MRTLFTFTVPLQTPSQWWDYKITPMATNLQFVFYRNKANDVLVKVLLNEDEATLPIKSDVIILTSDIEPSFSMIICTITRPCMPFSCATIGYFKVLFR